MGNRILLDGVTANTTGAVLALHAAIRVPLNTRLRTEGSCTLTVNGITNATVKVLGGSTAARLSLIGGGTFTADTMMELKVVPAFIRADVESYVGGTITVEVGY